MYEPPVFPSGPLAKDTPDRISLGNSIFNFPCLMLAVQGKDGDRIWYSYSCKMDGMNLEGIRQVDDKEVSWGNNLV